MKGRLISPGNVKGIALVSKDPIGFYGGINIKTGIVIEKGHPLEGKNVKDRILVFPCGKGSTVGSYVIYGLQKNGVAPKGIINRDTETIVATGVILAGIPCVDKIDIDQTNGTTGRTLCGKMVDIWDFYIIYIECIFYRAATSNN